MKLETSKSITLDTSETRVEIIAGILDRLKSLDIVALNLEGISDIADYFIIATVQSTAQMRAAAEQITTEFKASGVLPHVPAITDSPKWAILDYGSVVVHLFDRATRDHYRLEDLWGDAEHYEWSREQTA